MPDMITVIIPTACRGDLLRKCLQSLAQQTLQGFGIILVADGSGDWAVDLSKEYRCNLLRLPQSRGFAAAVNAGAALADSEYILLLNDDVELNRDWLRITAAVLDERRDAAFCCGKLYRPDGLLDNAGDAVSLAGSAWRLGHGRCDGGQFEVMRPVLGMPGTAALVRKNVWRELGGFDEDFVSYLEDVDFSLRAARRGYCGLYQPQARAVHHGGATSGGPESAGVFRLLTANQLIIAAKHLPVRFWLRVLWAQLLWAGMAVKKRLLGAWVSGIVRFLRLARREWQKGRLLQREGKQRFVALLKDSDAEIYADVCAPDRQVQDTFWRLYFALFPPRYNREHIKNLEDEGWRMDICTGGRDTKEHIRQ